MVKEQSWCFFIGPFYQKKKKKLFFTKLSGQSAIDSFHHWNQHKETIFGVTIVLVHMEFYSSMCFRRPCKPAWLIEFRGRTVKPAPSPPAAVSTAALESVHFPISCCLLLPLIVLTKIFLNTYVMHSARRK